MPKHFDLLIALTKYSFVVLLFFAESFFLFIACYSITVIIQ